LQEREIVGQSVERDDLAVLDAEPQVLLDIVVRGFDTVYLPVVDGPVRDIGDDPVVLKDSSHCH